MALWKSQMEEHTSDWLKVILISGLGQTMNGRTYRCMLCYPLGVPLFIVPKPCSACSRVFIGDIYGDHVVSFACIIGIKLWHNVVRDTLVDIRFWSGISVGKEVDIGFGGGREKPLRSADMLLYSWDGWLDILTDIYGDHAVSCAGIIGIKHRHNVVCDTLVDIWYQLGISTGKEVDTGLDRGHDKPLRPTDMLLNLWERGLDVCVDLTGSSPLTQTWMADFMPGRAVINAAHRKCVKYEIKCATIRYGFLPFSFSSLGELEKGVITLLKRIRNFSMSQDIKARAAVHIFNRIGFAIAKGEDDNLIFLYDLTGLNALSAPSFKLLDESQVVLKAPRKDDVYRLNLKNIVPSGGIKREFSMARTPQQNGVAERKTRPLLRQLNYVNRLTFNIHFGQRQ
ncbi:putative reverse transcriptase domain-containing protein [Tanacetum coccineum]